MGILFWYHKEEIRVEGWYKQFWRHVRRPWSRSQICEFAPQGVGLEVGCGEWTIAPVRRTILSDAFEEHVGNKSLAKFFFPADIYHIQTNHSHSF